MYSSENVSMGAVDDLSRATNLVRDMVMKFAMPYREGHGLLVLSDYEALNQKVLEDSFEEMQAYSAKLYEETKQILSNHKECIEKLSSVLMEKEILSEEEVKEFFEQYEGK